MNANVAASHAINNTGVQLCFPRDNSQASQLARINAATITLQNLFGPGVGCPQAATTFGVAPAPVRDTEAVAIDRRERTRSKGYVEPAASRSAVGRCCRSVHDASSVSRFGRCWMRESKGKFGVVINRTFRFLKLCPTGLSSALMEAERLIKNACV